MRRLLPRSPLSEDPREFVLAAILFTVGAVLFAGFGVTTLRGSAFSASDLASAGLALQVLAWGKWVAAVRLAWLGDHAVLHRRWQGAKRTALLWLPLLLFGAYAWLQRGVLDAARAAYLLRTGHADAADAGGTPLYLVLECGAALTLAAVNAFWVRGRRLRIAL